MSCTGDFAEMLVEILLVRALRSGSNKCKRQIFCTAEWPNQGCQRIWQFPLHFCPPPLSPVGTQSCSTALGRGCQGLFSHHPSRCWVPSTHGAGTFHGEPRTGKQPRGAGREKWSFPLTVWLASLGGTSQSEPGPASAALSRIWQLDPTG